VLTFQIDSALCSKSPHSINDFLEYDWVGAPWAMWPHLLSGNGGASELSFEQTMKLTEGFPQAFL